MHTEGPSPSVSSPFGDVKNGGGLGFKSRRVHFLKMADYTIYSKKTDNPGIVHKCDKWLGALRTEPDKDDFIAKKLRELSEVVLKYTGKPGLDIRLDIHN